MLTTIPEAYIIALYHPLTIYEDGVYERSVIASMIKNICVSLAENTGVLTQETPYFRNDDGDCEINIHASGDWEITGQYCANILRVITLKRTSSSGQRNEHV